MNAVNEMFAKASARLDGWFNILTGIGTARRDKRMSSGVAWVPLREQEAEELYAQDDTAAKIVDAPVDEAFRAGYKLTGLEDAQLEKVKTRAKELYVDMVVKEAWRNARIYGGGVIMKVTEDLASLAEEMGERPLIKSLLAFNRYEMVVNPDQINVDPRSPDFGSPLRYEVRPRHARGNVDTLKLMVHFSRIVRFDGVWLPRSQMERNQYWGDSVLTRPGNAIRNFNISHDAAATTLQDFSISVFKMKNLSQMLAADADQKVVSRMALMNLVKSVAQSVIIDADGEDFDHRSRSVAGVAELLGKVESRLVAATPFPHTVLFGESPSGGLGQSGNHEQTNWYDYVRREQTDYLKPKLMEIYELICDEQGIDHAQLDIEFEPLEEQNEKEQAEIRKLQAEVDKTYIEAGVIDQDEVATSRFPEEGGYSTDTKINHALRSPGEVLEADRERELNPPAPPPVPGQAAGQPGLPGQPAPAADPAQPASATKLPEAVE